MSKPAKVLTFPSTLKDNDRYLQQALREYLDNRYLPFLMFYELKPAGQRWVLDRALSLKILGKARQA